MNGKSSGYKVETTRNLRIPLSDGHWLSADLFRPETAEPVPVLFQYHPYRKSDISAGGQRLHRYLAQRGYAVLHLDVRGTGNSSGVATDEYSRQEQLDGVEAIAWMAAQPWSTGSVGMFGSSYSGFNSLQVAMHRPPALKAICPMYFTDNRYTDDCHYKGGTLQMLYDIGTYGLSMVTLNALPPEMTAGETEWAQLWADHLQSEPWILGWLANQVQNSYWQQGSLCVDYAAITCATFLIGGWRDGYTNCNLRTYAQLSCPKKLLIGPWLHSLPDVGVPGPRIDHLHEMVRWFDRWLRGQENGVDAEPPITLYVQRYDPPRADRPTTSGYWRHETGWPTERSTVQQLYLATDGTLQAAPPAAEETTSYRYNPTVGTSFGLFSAASPYVLPVDQQLEAAYAVNWSSAPLTAPLEILGQPQVTLTVAVSAEIATLAVRLLDIAPDGQMALVTKGVLNLTHRHSHQEPTPLMPGQPYTVELLLDATSWEFAPDHRIGLAAAGADFPNSWPSPLPYTASIRCGGAAPSRLSLPTVTPQTPPLPTPVLQPPAAADAGLPSYSDRPVWRVTRDHMAGTAEVFMRGFSHTRVSDEVTFSREHEVTALANERDPAHSSVNGLNRVVLYWQNRTIETRSRGQIESSADALHVTIQLEIRMHDLPYFSRQWTRTIPRRLL